MSEPAEITTSTHSSNFGAPIATLKRGWRVLLVSIVVGGALGIGISFLIKPTFVARTVVMPPQQQGSSLSALSGQLGALSGLAGIGGVKSTADQYVSLLGSVSVSDQIIDQFKLMDVYDMKYRSDMRKKLAAGVVNIAANKKDGLITIDVEDHDPQRAANMANAYVDKLRSMTDQLAVTEAKQRRIFFEKQLSDTKDRLTQAQVALQSTGIDSAALKAEPQSAASNYARLRAELTSAEVRLESLSSGLTSKAPELQSQQATVAALRRQLADLENSQSPNSTADYVGRYREFKYQEALFDVYARQFELARLDESREGALIQVVDPAIVPDKKSKPKRLYYGLAFAGIAFAACATFLLRRRALASAAPLPT